MKNDVRFAVIDGGSNDDAHAGIAPDAGACDPFDVVFDGDDNVHYLPGAWYYRTAIRRSFQFDELRETALSLVLEHERLCRWIETKGKIPPRWTVHVHENEAKKTLDWWAAGAGYDNPDHAS